MNREHIFNLAFALFFISSGCVVGYLTRQYEMIQYSEEQEERQTQSQRVFVRNLNTTGGTDITLKRYTNFNYIYSDSVKKEIQSLWNNHTEMGLCVDGWVTQHNVTFNKIIHHYTGDSDSIALPNCTGMMMVHTHPNNNCVKSPADIDYFRDAYNVKGTMFDMVVCEDKIVMNDYEHIGITYEVKI